uniref:Ig-like domain-containing protein n=1 Tax=Malurus cyaneus samueli TaxID=2593467 RepID=A0A8C5TW52_9PASS
KNRFGFYLFLLFHYFLQYAHSPLVSTEHFKPTPLQNVLGIVGRDTILPCTISSTKPLENPQVQWGKITDGHTENIYTYMGQLGGESGQKYCGRTSMPGDGFATGNVSLTLKNVQPADEGIYSCTVISRDWSADTATKLSIAGGRLPGLEVFIEILGPKGRGLELGCRSHGWFPEPTVQWVTEYGQGLFADTEIHQDSRKLFSVWSRVTVTGEQGGKVTCEILNPLVQVEKKTTVLVSAGRRMALGDVSWGELEGSLPLPPLVSSSPSLQWSSSIRAGPFFPEVSMEPPTLARASAEISASAAMAGDRPCFPGPVPGVPALWCQRAQPCSALSRMPLWVYFPPWMGAGAGPC